MQQKFHKKTNEQQTGVRKTRIIFLFRKYKGVLIQINTAQKNNNITKKQVQELLENNQKKLGLNDKNLRKLIKTMISHSRLQPRCNSKFK